MHTFARARRLLLPMALGVLPFLLAGFLIRPAFGRQAPARSTSVGANRPTALASFGVGLPSPVTFVGASKIASATVTITGTVMDSGGGPPAGALIIALEPASYTIVTYTVTYATDHYALVVPANASYILVGIPSNGTELDGYELHGLTPRGGPITVQTDPVRYDFTFEPCHELILEGYDANGALVPSADTEGFRFTAALTDSVARGVFTEVHKGSGPTIPAACIPPNVPRRLFVLWTVPGFGRVVVWADNGGAGFQGAGGTGTVLNLNYELARTQVSRLQANYTQYVDAGYVISPNIGISLTLAETDLATAASYTGTERASWADQALSTTLWALEEMELARARQDITRYRRGDLTVFVRDAGGNPLPGATVAYTQTDHDFLFGVFGQLQSAGTSGYQLMKQAGINYVTSGFYWSDIEPNEGQILWNHIDHEVGVTDLAAMGFRQKAHPLIWLSDLVMPDYLKAKSFAALNTAIDTHVRALVSHYRGPIRVWEVINEAHGRWASGGFTQQQVITLTRTGIRAIRETDPEGRISINAAFDWYGENKFSSYYVGPEDTYSIPAWQYFDRLIAEGIDFDIIGQQLYNGGAILLFQRLGVGNVMYVPTWDIAHLSAVMDHLQTYGKPVHLTEESVSGTFDPSWKASGWWHHPWDRETQAAFARAYYTIGFSKPHNEAITWWDVNDVDSFMEEGGLLDSADNPKPVYDAIKALIAGWTTQGSETAGTSGEARLQGYGGNYQIAVAFGGRAVTTTAHLTEQQSSRITVTLGSYLFLPVLLAR